MLAGREHELGVSLEIAVRFVAAARDERLHEHFRELEIERVFTGAKELMVVNVPPAPVFRLVVEDFAARVQRGVFRAPEDAARMRIPWREIVAHDAVVPVERRPIVIPMDRHRQRVADEGTPCHAVKWIAHCNFAASGAVAAWPWRFRSGSRRRS